MDKAAIPQPPKTPEFSTPHPPVFVNFLVQLRILSVNSTKKFVNNSLRTRKDLCADSLFGFLREQFEKIPDARPHPETSLADALMSGFALFALKDPSLLAFEKRSANETIKNIFHIGAVSSDTHMRRVLDEVPPEKLMPIFKKTLAILQRGKGLEDMVFYNGHYLISNDGTEYFNSEKIHCSECLTRKQKNSKTEYHHNFLGSAIVHPDKKVVIPICPEPIKNADGTEKNDCEQNGSKRWLARFRREHPHMKAIIVEDALSSNAPHLKELKKYDLRFIIGIKPGSHAYLFSLLADKKSVSQHEMRDEKGVHHIFRFQNDVSINEGNADVRVNVMDYCEEKPNGKKQFFTWVTDIPITEENAFAIMRGGRARWKIENETFNTLKNQGYHFEHNFGHGEENLSTIFALLMMLAFLVDQIQQKCCRVFQAAWEKCGSKRELWEKIRSHVHVSAVYGITFFRMADILTTIAQGKIPISP